MMETIDDVAAVVASDDELEEAARRVGAGEIRGAVLLDQPALQSMQHAGLFATAIFNPFGPTVETVSLASFDGDWHEGRVLLLRRGLNPFADAYVQVLSFYPGLRESWDYIDGDLARFVANNGMRPHTKDWARPLCRTLPTGIITTQLAHDVALTPILNRAFGWLFSLAEPNLAADIELLVRYGGDLWERASAEMDSVLSSLGVAASARSGADVTGELSVPEPTNDAPWSGDFDRAPSFDRWWGLATHEYYQSQLYHQLPRAWTGSQGQLPGLRQAPGDEDDDFSAWWALFRPGEGVTSPRSG
jgi:hypothetical protein